MSKGWMLFDTVSGNAIDMTNDPDVAREWEEDTHLDETCVVIEYDEGGVIMAKKKKVEEEVVEMEPGDDTAEAQPSIEREGAATGRTGGGSSAPGESGGTSSAGNG